MTSVHVHSWKVGQPLKNTRSLSVIVIIDITVIDYSVFPANAQEQLHIDYY